MILTYGFTRMRWLFAAIGLFVVLGLFTPGANLLLNIVLLMACGLFFFLFWQARKMQFDTQYLYIIRGKDESAIPLRNVKSLKRSRTKVNNRRLWVLVYEDEGVQERKCRFLPSRFADYTKEFKAAIQAANPNVVIWNHPHFNH